MNNSTHHVLAYLTIIHIKVEGKEGIFAA